MVYAIVHCAKQRMRKGHIQMKIKRLTEHTISDIQKKLKAPLTESDLKALSKIIENSLVEAVKHSTKRCSTAAITACGAELDIAHKISKEVELTRNALIANLKSMR